MGCHRVLCSPLLFIIYMKLLYEITHHYGMKYHQYGHDSQLYISVAGDVSDAVDILSWCLEVMVAWMGNNRLQLNALFWICRLSLVNHTLVISHLD